MLAPLYLILWLAVSQSEAARILGVFPTPSISHQVVFRPLLQELAKRGHEVVVITPDPAFPIGGAPLNLMEIDVHDISYNIWRDKLMGTSRGNSNDLNEMMKMVMEIQVEIVDAQMKHKEVQKLLSDKNRKFDLLLAEACVRTSLMFSHIYKIPTIQISSLGAVMNNFQVMGAPRHPFLYPVSLQLKINNLTVWEKIDELYNTFAIDNIFSDSIVAENELIRKHLGAEAPTLTDLFENVHMLFLNVNPIFEGIRPVPPTIVYIGGIHQNEEKELPADLRTYLDTSTNGVIYLSFGTNVDPAALPPEIIQILVKVLSQLPYNVIWKWNKDVLPGRTDNIKISKWLPQSDLLKHPNVKLFITQGGLQSTDEAITAGVPMVGIPMLGDQWFNVERYVYHKIGVRLDLETLTEEKLRNSVTTVLNDKSYRENIIRLRERMRDEPMTALERAVWWTEYLLRHGGATHLRSPAANITWAEFLELELIFTLLAIVVSVTVLLFIFLRLVCRYLINKLSFDGTKKNK